MLRTSFPVVGAHVEDHARLHRRYNDWVDVADYDSVAQAVQEAGTRKTPLYFGLGTFDGPDVVLTGVREVAGVGYGTILNFRMSIAEHYTAVRNLRMTRGLSVLTGLAGLSLERLWITGDVAIDRAFNYEMRDSFLTGTVVHGNGGVCVSYRNVYCQSLGDVFALNFTNQQAVDISLCNFTGGNGILLPGVFPFHISSCNFENLTDGIQLGTETVQWGDGQIADCQFQELRDAITIKGQPNTGTGNGKEVSLRGIRFHTVNSVVNENDQPKATGRIRVVDRSVVAANVINASKGITEYV